jgi:hypothetical protein
MVVPPLPIGGFAGGEIRRDIVGGRDAAHPPFE